MTGRRDARLTGVPAGSATTGRSAPGRAGARRGGAITGGAGLPPARTRLGAVRVRVPVRGRRLRHAASPGQVRYVPPGGRAHRAPAGTRARPPALDPRRPALARHLRRSARVVPPPVPGGHGPAGRAVGVVGGRHRCRRARVGVRAVGPRVPGRRHAHVPLAVRRRLRPRRRSRGRSEPQGGLPDPQQRARCETDRAGAHPPAVQRRAVGGAEVGDRDPAVRADRHRAVHPGDVRVVERHVGVGGAAYADLAAVQQVHPARVGTGDDMEPGRGVVQLGMRLRLARGAHGQHRTVDQRRLAERAALGVQPPVTGVQHRGARGAGRAVAAGDRRGQRGGDRGQGRAGGCRDQHVAARGPVPRGGGRAQRVNDGQPDLHRRQRSLLRGRPRHGGRSRPAVPLRGLPPPPHAHVRPVLGGILAPATDNAPAARHRMILIGRLCP